jgi:DNA end-binding protein Ku
MPRTTWKGSLSFGLVAVPISLYPATQDFNQFEKGTVDRIRL